MKRIFIAIALGLTAGWIVSQLIHSNTNRTHDSDHVVKTEIRQSMLTRLGPAAPQARTALSLDEQRTTASEGQKFSPYRNRLFSMDLVKSLSVDQLIEAFQAGQIRDSVEIATALGKVAESDPRLALRLVREIPGRDAHDRARRAVVAAWVKSDAQSLLKHIQALAPNAYRKQLARDLAWEWGKHDPEAAAEEINVFEEMIHPRENVSDSLITQWAEKDYEAAERWINEKANSARKSAMLDSLLAGKIAGLEGSEAVEFLLARSDQASVRQHLAKAFQTWASGDPESAITRFAAMPEGHPIWKEIEGLGSKAMMSLLHFGGRDKILTWQHKLPEGQPRTEFLLGAANIASSNDIPTAEKIIAEIPESRERERAVGMFTELWMRKDPVALSEWLSTLETSPSRDNAVYQFARLLAKSDPERARDWAETISDQDRKQRLRRNFNEQ